VLGVDYDRRRNNKRQLVASHSVQHACNDGPLRFYEIVSFEDISTLSNIQHTLHFLVSSIVASFRFNTTSVFP